MTNRLLIYKNKACYLLNLIFLSNTVSKSIIRTLYNGQWIENEEKTKVKVVCNKKNAKPFSFYREIVTFATFILLWYNTRPSNEALY